MVEHFGRQPKSALEFLEIIYGFVIRLLEHPGVHEYKLVRKLILTLTRLFEILLRRNAISRINEEQRERFDAVLVKLFNLLEGAGILLVDEFPSFLEVRNAFNNSAMPNNLSRDGE